MRAVALLDARAYSGPCPARDDRQPTAPVGAPRDRPQARRGIIVIMIAKRSLTRMGGSHTAAAIDRGAPAEPRR